MTANQIPARLLQRQSRGLAASAVQGLGVASPPRISTRQNRFWLLDSAGNATPVNSFTLDVVIVDVNDNVSKTFYDTEWDPNATEHEAPACWSDNGIGPSAQASKPQSASCAMCPWNQWGSDRSRVTGKETKACSDTKKVAVIVPGGPETPYLLQISPASLKHFRAYAQQLAASSLGDRPVDMSDVVTQLSFDPTVQGVLNFAAVGWIDDAIADRLDLLDQDREATATLVGMRDQVRTAPIQQAPALAAPAAQPGYALPASQPAPQLLPPAHQPQFAPPPAQAFTPPPAQQPHQPAPAAPAAPAKRARRAPAPAQAPAAQTPPAAPAAPAIPEIPAFLQRQPAAAPAAPAPVAPAGQFGLAPAQAPDAALAARIGQAFALPTKG